MLWIWPVGVSTLPSSTGFDGDPPAVPPPTSNMLMPSFHSAVNRKPSRTNTSWMYGEPIGW